MDDSNIWDNLREVLIKEMKKIQEKKGGKEEGYKGTDFFINFNVHNEGQRVKMTKYDRVTNTDWRKTRESADDEEIVEGDYFLMNIRNRQDN